MVVNAAAWRAALPDDGGRGQLEGLRYRWRWTRAAWRAALPKAVNAGSR